MDENKLRKLVNWETWSADARAWARVGPGLATPLHIEAINPSLQQTCEQQLKAVFHFKRIVAYRSIFFCANIISSTRVLMEQRNTLRFATIRAKWKTGFNGPADSCVNSQISDTSRTMTRQNNETTEGAKQTLLYEVRQRHLLNNSNSLSDINNKRK